MRKDEHQAFGCLIIVVCLVSVPLCFIHGDNFDLGLVFDTESLAASRALCGLVLALLVIALIYAVKRIRNGPFDWTWNTFKPWWLILLSPLMIALAIFLTMHSGVVGIEGGKVITDLPPALTLVMRSASVLLFLAGITSMANFIMLVLFAIDRLASSIVRVVARMGKT